MSLTRITPDEVETFTLETNPSRTFSSSSVSGPTGSVRVFPRGSEVEKEVQPLSQFKSTVFSDIDLNEFIKNAKRRTSGSSNVFNQVQSYMNAVNSQSVSLRKQQEVEIIRFEPSFKLSSNTLRKSVVVNTLMPYYRSVYPTAHFNYTNYHCLNFFTASSVPNQTAILYPNSSSTGKESGYYVPTGAFSFDFWINPRYKGEVGAAYKAGTLLHLSSCYAVSLVTGSSKDENGYPNGFRILVQLSTSADVPPSLAASGAFTFFSDDNSLKRNHWHHVTFRWGTNDYNQGSGSFVVDGEIKGRFVIPSASVIPTAFTSSADTPKVLCVGNYYEGTNTGTQAQALFFTEAIATKDGLLNLLPSDTSRAPSAFGFNHPLNAEVHELKIYNKYLTDDDIESLDSNAPSKLDDLLFYVPPFFVRESPTRKYVSDLGEGGILVTPFKEEDGTTEDPFNIKFSYGVGGHYINIENFVKDFATGNYPRLFNLTASAILDQQQTPQSANDFLYHTGSNIKRSLTILPCDNGLTYPNFDFLKNGSPLRDPTKPSTAPITGSTDKFRNDLKNYDYGSITLRDLVTTSSYRTGIVYASGSIVDDFVGARPENLKAKPGQVLTILQRTRDNTSNQVCFFDVSNLFYGKSIKPGSLVIKDTAYSGSSGKVSFTLKDDGYGNVYRADALTKVSTWNSVGNIFYNEGIIMIKSPHLFFFGKDEFEISFQGVQDIHILSFNLVARPAMVTSSSNPSYLPVSASSNANDTDQRFVYLNGVNLHDDNLNVIMKTTFAQPIIKRTGDRITVKIKIDF